MSSNIRLVVAVIMLLMVVAVDFTSKILSVMADGFLVAVIAVVAWPLVRKANNAP